MWFAPRGPVTVKPAAELAVGDQIVNVGEVRSVTRETPTTMFVTVVVLATSWSAATGTSHLHDVAAYLHVADDVVVVEP
jgi:hypothetical protein